MFGFELDVQVDRAANRLLTAPGDLTDILASKLTELWTERQRAVDRRLGAAAGTQLVDVEAETECAVNRLWRLGQELETANPANLQ